MRMRIKKILPENQYRLFSRFYNDDYDHDDDDDDEGWKTLMLISYSHLHSYAIIEQAGEKTKFLLIVAQVKAATSLFCCIIGNEKVKIVCLFHYHYLDNLFVFRFHLLSLDENKSRKFPQFSTLQGD